jgi:hypothetical protein
VYLVGAHLQKRFFNVPNFLVQQRYTLYLGAEMPMFSTPEAEDHLKHMHVANHRELAIAKFAARVADCLWPRCQENVDEAIAEYKVMASKSRVHVPEPYYEPPKVPHFLPLTCWCALQGKDYEVVELNWLTVDST